VLYPASLGVIKLSIILFFIRILPPEHAWKKALYGLASWVVVSETAFTVALFLQCRPLNYYWDKTVKGTCFDQPKFYYVDAALNMATDLVILSVPWFVFRGGLARQLPHFQVPMPGGQFGPSPLGQIADFAISRSKPVSEEKV
jgi:hypothetical protein